MTLMEKIKAKVTEIFDADRFMFLMGCELRIPYRPKFMFLMGCELRIPNRPNDLDSPFEFKYIKRVAFTLTTIASWPHKQFGRPSLDSKLMKYNIFLIFVAILYPSLGAAYIWHNRDTITFFSVGHQILCMFLDFMCLQRLIMARTDKYREIIRDYLVEFHLVYFRKKSEYAAKIHSQIHIISGMFVFYMITQMSAGMCLFVLMPWYNNYRAGMFSDERPENSTFEHAVYLYCFTDDVYTTLRGYWVLFTVNCPVSYNTTVGVMIIDLLLSLIVLQIWGHMKILIHNLSSIAPVEGMYSPEENLKIRQTLKDNITHHGMIIKFVDKCSDAFSEHLFVFYLLMQIITCTLLLEVSFLTPEAIAKYGPLTLLTFQLLIQVSCLFELIHTQSMKLIDVVYAVPWECMDTSNRRTFTIFLHRVQDPVALKAAKVVPVGVQTMASVLKTTVSYYMVLNAVADQ